MRVVDIHTHGIGGYSTRTTNPDDILKMAQIHGEYGATDIVPTIYSGTITTMRENLSAVKEAIKRQRSWGIEQGVKRKDSGSFNSTHDTRPACSSSSLRSIAIAEDGRVRRAGTQNSGASRVFTSKVPSLIRRNQAPLMGHPFKNLLLKHG
jgi:hypothetical protein